MPANPLDESPTTGNPAEGQELADRLEAIWRNKPAMMPTMIYEKERDIILTALRSSPSHSRDADFQTGVDRWMDQCFGEPIKSDQLERADRFTEEALELAQTMPGFTKERAHALVDYVFDRPQGEINQEVGGVMVTLAALCNTTGVRIDEAAATELARVWTKVEQIRAKQAAKPTGSALPVKPPVTGVDGDSDGGSAGGES